MAEKKKRIQITTPPGILVWPKLNQINYGTEKYPVKDGNFETKIVIDKSHPEFVKFAHTLEPLYDEARKVADKALADMKMAARKDLEKKVGEVPKRRDWLSAMYEEETGEELDTVQAKASMRAGGVIKNGPKAGQIWTSRPKAFDANGKPIALFNAAGQPLAHAPRIYSGTKARLALEVDTNKDGSIGYFVALDGTYGIRLSLRAVQIITLKSAAEQTADQFGFGKEEDGYSFDETQPETFGGDDTSADTSNDTAISGDF